MIQSTLESSFEKNSNIILYWYKATDLLKYIFNLSNTYILLIKTLKIQKRKENHLYSYHLQKTSNFLVYYFFIFLCTKVFYLFVL